MTNAKLSRAAAGPAVAVVAAATVAGVGLVNMSTAHADAQPKTRVTFICKMPQTGDPENVPGADVYQSGDYIFRIREEAGVPVNYDAGVHGSGLFSGSLAAGGVDYPVTRSPIAGVSVKTDPGPNSYRGTASTNEVQPCTLVTSTVTLVVRVFDDSNRDLSGNGESGVPGSVVTLNKDGAQVGTATVGPNGYASFVDVAVPTSDGQYTVSATPASGYVLPAQQGTQVGSKKVETDESVVSVPVSSFVDRVNGRTEAWVQFAAVTQQTPTATPTTEPRRSPRRLRRRPRSPRRSPRRLRRRPRSPRRLRRRPRSPPRSPRLSRRLMRRRLRSRQPSRPRSPRRSRRLSRRLMRRRLRSRQPSRPRSRRLMRRRLRSRQPSRPRNRRRSLPPRPGRCRTPVLPRSGT